MQLPVHVILGGASLILGAIISDLVDSEAPQLVEVVLIAAAVYVSVEIAAAVARARST